MTRAQKASCSAKPPPLTSKSAEIRKVQPHRGITCGIAEIASVAWPRYWWRRALHPLRGDAPVTWQYTRSERVHCLRIGCTAQRSNTPKKSLPPRTHHPQTGTHEATRPPSTAGVKGAGGTRRPGCSARERRGLASRGGADTTTSQMSHVIYRGHFSRCPKNVAIPTT